MRQQEMLKGNTDTLLLALLESEAMYGYQIVREIGQKSSGYFQFKEGTLYPALHRLENERLVEGVWEESPTGQQRRYYYLTATGRRTLSEKLEEWRQFSGAVNQVMSTATL